MATLMTTLPIAIFGEVLFDRFEDGLDILGGAPFNVAWHLQAFQQSPLFISRIGQDQAGAKIQAAMQRWGMSQTALQIDTHYPTGAVEITLNNGEPDYQILANQAYDFIDAQLLPAIDCAVLYHGSLAVRQSVSNNALQTLINRHQGKVFIDINLRQPWWNQTVVAELLARANWVKLNHQELQQLQTEGDLLETKMRLFIQRYQLEVLVVTLGEQGALAIDVDGELLTVQPDSHQQVVDTVGAGDAFASVLLLGILKAWPLAVSLQRAQQFASALVGQRGATVSDLDFYQPFKAAWL
jgi:fructokinase